MKPYHGSYHGFMMERNEFKFYLISQGIANKYIINIFLSNFYDNFVGLHDTKTFKDFVKSCWWLISQVNNVFNFFSALKPKKKFSNSISCI